MRIELVGDHAGAYGAEIMPWHLSPDAMHPNPDLPREESALAPQLSLTCLQSTRWSAVRDDFRDAAQGPHPYSAWFSGTLQRLPVRSEDSANTALWNACRGIWRPPMR
jgi:hypothetical protein